MTHFLTGDSLPRRERQLSKDQNSFQFQRVVRAYEKHGDRLVHEFPLQDANLYRLQELFGETEQNEMVDSYPISNIQADYLQQQLRTTFDFEALDYFLECDAV